MGVPALTANISSAVGVVPSYLGGIAGFRAEIAELGGQLRRLLVASLAGGALGYPGLGEARTMQLGGILALVCTLLVWRAARSLRDYRYP